MSANPFDNDEWLLVWRPEWPQVGMCPLTGEPHPMSPVAGYWHCQQCWAHFSFEEMAAVAAHGSHGLELAKLHLN